MPRSFAFTLIAVCAYTYAMLELGFAVGQWKQRLIEPAPVVCPTPKTEPERCLAYWFGTDNKADLRQRVCGKDFYASPRH